jgi:excisionase family DNA binding protein
MELEFITPHQLADRWQMHVETIRRWVRERKLASVVLGRRKMIALSEVRRFEADGTIPSGNE